MKKLLALLAIVSTASAFADDTFSGTLTINTNNLNQPFINASANTIKDQNGKILQGYTSLTSGINNLYFNTVMKKGGYMPYSMQIGLNFGGIGLDGSSIGWSANDDTPGSSYTFSIVPPMYPVGQQPAAGSYCISVAVGGNLISAPICSVEIQKTDSYNSDIWYVAGGVTTVTVPGFLANSNVTISVVPGAAQHARCSRSSEWATPNCTFSSSVVNNTSSVSQSSVSARQPSTGSARLFF